jgi:hypothetical protein
VPLPEDDKRVLCYAKVPKDKHGWTVDMAYRPAPYDLVAMKIQDFDRIINGWWTGFMWEGYRLKPHDRVIAWKMEATHQGRASYFLPQEEDYGQVDTGGDQA